MACIVFGKVGSLEAKTTGWNWGQLSPSSPVPMVLCLIARPYIQKVPQPPKTAPPTGDQVLKPISLRFPFRIPIYWILLSSSRSSQSGRE